MHFLDLWACSFWTHARRVFILHVWRMLVDRHGPDVFVCNFWFLFNKLREDIVSLFLTQKKKNYIYIYNPNYSDVSVYSLNSVVITLWKSSISRWHVPVSNIQVTTRTSSEIINYEPLFSFLSFMWTINRTKQLSANKFKSTSSSI